MTSLIVVIGNVARWGTVVLVWSAVRCTTPRA
jgi:hypothetical protein